MLENCVQKEYMYHQTFIFIHYIDLGPNRLIQYVLVIADG